MKKFFSAIVLGLSISLLATAQEEEKTGLEISGSVDTYFKYDFSGESQIPTSFASDQNSVSIGMLDLGLSQTVGKASFVGEISFGPRGQAQSLVQGEYGSFNIQNLYVSYALSDVVSLTAGYMGTFVGYEVISPAANFNYSTSYLFTSGPFQNAGIKADFALADNFGLMVGLFNDWNIYTDFNGVSDIGAQVYYSPADGMDIYLNAIHGYNDDAIYMGEPGKSTEIDLTAGFQLSDAFYLGVNAATATYKLNNGTDEKGGFSGIAFYPQYSFSDKVALGYRGEYFVLKDTEIGGVTNDGSNVFSSTLTLNYYAGPLTFSTELRLDSASKEWYSDSDGDPTKSATQFLLAAIYSF
nr:outer membrane beta-barrel protein [uncultured Carboxylicivirga sp.]